MAEGLATPQGTVLDVPAASVEQDFAAAMAAPEPSEAVPAPPKKEPTDPEAPYGRRADGTPKKGPGGRPSKDKAEQPRVQTSAAPAAGGRSFEEYQAGLNEVAMSVWSVLAMTPPTMAQAALFKVHRPNLVHGLALGATQNERLRGAVDWVIRESWMMVLGGALVPFVMQSIALWTAPERLGVSREELQAITINDLQVLQQQAADDLRRAASEPMAA